MSREAEIRLTIILNEDNVPEEMYWEATEAEEEGRKKCEALMLSMWDKEKRNSLSIDLWTTSMEVAEMNSHYYNTLMKLAETYERATNNSELSRKMQDFASEFARLAGEAESENH